MRKRAMKSKKYRIIWRTWRHRQGLNGGYIDGILQNFNTSPHVQVRFMLLFYRPLLFICVRKLFRRDFAFVLFLYLENVNKVLNIKCIYFCHRIYTPNKLRDNLAPRKHTAMFYLEYVYCRPQITSHNGLMNNHQARTSNLSTCPLLFSWRLLRPPMLQHTRMSNICWWFTFYMLWRKHQLHLLRSPVPRP